MQKLIDLTKGHERVFINLRSAHAKAGFLKQAEEEGFMLGSKLPTQCECESVMIIHSDYTLNYCVGMAANWLYHSKQSVVVDYDEIMG